MSLTPSSMLPLGTPLPSFRAKDPYGNVISSEDDGEFSALLIMFLCNHCPYVKHIKEHLAELVKEYQEKNVRAIAFNSNDAEAYPDDSPEKMRKDIETFSYSFPYCIDDTQEIARSFQAACTPDFYLFDSKRLLVYRGQLDDSRPNTEIPVTGSSLRASLDALLSGKDLPKEQKPSLGCNIKWKSEEE